MIDICCCGKLGDLINPITRTIMIEKIVQDGPDTKYDIFPICEWCKKEKTYFMQLSSGTLVVVRGRMETSDEVGPVIVVEQLTTLSSFKATTK